jgi:TraX protein/NAD binding domain of 6-phosphogluconate dehydrogenase
MPDINDKTYELSLACSVAFLGLGVMGYHMAGHLARAGHQSEFYAAPPLTQISFEINSLAMPLFTFVLAYNLARPGALAAGIHRRMAVRLAVFGTLSTLPYIAITGVLGGWWPLNMLFTLLLLTGIC